MWPALDKETVLSKVINNVDIFRINLWHGDEDTKKKYINMVVKLDSSKTILLDTKGPEIRTRNKEELFLEEGEDIIVEFSESFKDSDDILYIDYHKTDDLPVWTILEIDSGSIILEITKNNKNRIIAKIVTWGMILINRQIEFEWYIPDLPFLWEKDKKHIVRGIEHQVNAISVSFTKSGHDIKMIKSFLNTVDGQFLRVIAKIETVEALEDSQSLIEEADGIIMNEKKLLILLWDKKKVDAKKEEIMLLCHTIWKPVVIISELETSSEEKTLGQQKDFIKKNLSIWCDAFMLTRTSAVSEFTVDNILELYEIVNLESNKPIKTDYKLSDLPPSADSMISDYITFTAYRSAKELPIKAIICPTESWYTPARLSSLKPDIPIIAFTKNDAAYRYMNFLWGVKGYKIAPSFEYTSIKEIGKEIIRILFKGNISLDDKILIVHSSLEQNTPGMINGMELYKFKDI